FSVGAVNIRTGNFVYFDSTTHRIAPAHIIASGSLPPGLPATEIDGEYYWDGGIVSNTPLQWVLDSRPRRDTLAFQIDLRQASCRAIWHRLTCAKRRFASPAAPGRRLICTRKHNGFASPLRPCSRTFPTNCGIVGRRTSSPRKPIGLCDRPVDSSVQSLR